MHFTKLNCNILPYFEISAMTKLLALFSSLLVFIDHLKSYFIQRNVDSLFNNSLD